MSALPSGTVTLLFTDVEGSTQLLQALGASYEAALARHRDAVTRAVDGNGGVVVDSRGEEVFAAFQRAADAVAASVAIQAAHVGEPLRTRIGVHTGEPSLSGDGYLGLDVHRAARICAAGHGGQILLSQTTRELVPDADVLDLGEHKLRGIGRPERIFQLAPVGLASTFPGLVSDGRGRRQLSSLLLRIRPRRNATLEELAWRVRGRMPRAGRDLRGGLASLGAALFEGNRVATEAQRWLRATDRRRLGRSLEEYEDASILSRRAEELADAARRRLELVDEVAERVGTLRAFVLDPRAEGGDSDVSALREDVRAATAEVETALSAARAAVGRSGVRRRRTLRHGVYRSDDGYVVPHVDEAGVERDAEFPTAAEAAAFRRVLRLQRKAQRDFTGAPVPPLDSHGGGGPT